MKGRSKDRGRRVLRYAIPVLVSLAGACATTRDAASERSPEAPGTRMVTVAPDVRLEVVDWGGSGPPMVFLVGAGMEADNYERFASRLRDSYHVYGLNRRGAGASSIPSTGYDAATRAHDIVVVLDSLHVDRAILVGHSFAGDELSKVGVTYPARVRALVYLEAYDYPLRDTLPPLPPQARRGVPVAKSRASSRLVAALEASDTQQAPDSSAPRAAPIDPLALMQAGAENADYAALTVPALAVYADHPATAAEIFSGEYDWFDATNRSIAARYAAAVHQSYVRVQDRFRTQVRRGTVLVIPGADHLIYGSNPDEVEHAMREFLARVL